MSTETLCAELEGQTPSKDHFYQNVKEKEIQKMRLAKCGKEWKTVKPTHKKIYTYK